MMLWPQLSFSQDITLLQQFNGRYDFTFIGNTLNTIENGSIFADCTITTSSSAVLSLAPNDVIEKAYLYWAGSGPGDFTVKLNGLDVVPERTFNLTQSTSGFIFFSAFTDITAMVQATGNGVYLFSDLDVSAIIPDYCTNRTNFAGWAIVIVYQNNALPLNQLNVYDGLEYVAQDHEELVITLDNLNVIDNDNAQIGFVAWEGDSGIANNESLSVNGNLMSNALNPSNNAFNGTNSITGSSALYNMDLDIYNVQNNIDIGDTSAEIKLTSSQDFVMINCIVTKFNSQLPDATIVGGNVTRQCDLRTILCDYTIYNVNATDPLPAGTPFAIYAGTTLVGTGLTQAELPVGGSEAGQMAVVIPPEIPIDFDLVFVVDDDGTGTGFVTELSENNNTYVTQVSLLVSPAFNVPTDLISCNQGLGSGTFDFSAYEDLVRTNTDDTVSYYESQTDAESGVSPILNAWNYFTPVTPKQIFVRIANGSCFSTTSFFLRVRNCPPTVYNYVSANTDGTNDTFFIEGLRDIFLKFDLAIYNRWGVLIWEGNNNKPDWDGHATKGMRAGGNEVPDGTYYYVLDLNDPDYREPLTGFLYLNR
jgi:gliding motility-associated-like protein